MGRTRKPVNLKVVQGTFRKDRDMLPIADIQASSLLMIPSAPDWLTNVHALAEWNRLAPILMATNVLTEGSLSCLGVLCATHGKVVQAFAAGEAPSGALLIALRNMNSDFGITPASQSKVLITAKAQNENPFLKNEMRSRK